MPASNTKDCFRDVVGLTVAGVIFDALPVARPDLAAGNKTLVFADGTGLTISSNGSYWRENKPDVDRAIAQTRRKLAQTQTDLEDVLALAGATDNA